MICDNTGEDIFFHYDDMEEAGFSRYMLIFGSNKPNIQANMHRIKLYQLEQFNTESFDCQQVQNILSNFEIKDLTQIK